MKLLILSDFAAPYRIAVFKGLAQEHDISVFFTSATNESRNPKWYATSGKELEFSFLNTPEAIASYNDCIRNIKQYDIVLCYTPWHKISRKLQRLCWRKKVPCVLNADGALGINTSFPKKQIKTFYVKRATLCLAGCRRAAEYFRTYGAKEKQIVMHPFSSIHRDQIISAPYSPEQKAAFKAELGMENKVTFVTVGQFIPRKGFDLLLDAWGKTEQNAQLFIIGGGPLEEEYKRTIEEKGLKNVHIEGFKTPDILVKYYRAADVYVMPTREDIWGLVINEAMAEGLPIITSDRCTAGNELVIEGENGYHYPLENTALLAAHITKLTDDEALRAAFSEKALSIIREQTIENIIASHLACLDRIVKR